MVGGRIIEQNVYKYIIETNMVKSVLLPIIFEMVNYMIDKNLISKIF